MTKLVKARIFPTMKPVNVYEAKTHLSALLERARAGEEIVIARNGEPIAKLAPLSAGDGRPSRVPQFGLWEHEGYGLPDDFDEPDPELEALFYGEHSEST